MNNNTIESIEWHRNQLAKLLPEDDFGKVESELDSILEKAKSKKKVLVRRGGKTFYREQEVGSDGKDAYREKQIKLSQMNLKDAEKRNDDENVKKLKLWIKRLESGEKLDYNDAPSGYGREITLAEQKNKKLTPEQKKTLFG